MIKFNKITTYAMTITLACSGIAFAMEEDKNSKCPVKKELSTEEKLGRESARVAVQVGKEAKRTEKKVKKKAKKFGNSFKKHKKAYTNT